MKITKMFAIGFYLSLTILFAYPVFAQSPDGGMGRPDPETMATRNAYQLGKELKKATFPLSKEQETQVNALYQDGAKKMQAIFQENAGDRETVRSKMQPIKEEQDKKLKEILTASQWDYYEKNLKNKRSGGGPGN